MVIDGSALAKQNWNNSNHYNINIDLPTLTIFCKYILQDARMIRMEHLVNLRRLFNMIDKSTYENDPDKIKRINFIMKALEARLDYNLTDLDLILNHINGGIQYDIEFVDLNNFIMDRANIKYCHKIVEDLIKYAFFYKYKDDFLTLLTEFNTADISKRAPIIKACEDLIDGIKNEFRKAHVEDNLNDVTFSLDEGIFENAITDTWNLITNPSRRLLTGMQGFNELIGGGFESGRVYMLIGAAGVGKSLTLLNLINQMKRYNTRIRGKDPSKTPCIVLLTMENTVVETITRLFDMVIDESCGMDNYSLDEVMYKMRNEGGLRITESSPLDIVIRFKPNRSISTDYLYTLYDDLMDMGKEPVCFIQDHVKRIRSIDYTSDLRIELGNVINEFKVFAGDKDIPFITVSHLNREATRILEEAARKGAQDGGKLVGKSNTGESLLMIENVDFAFTLAKDWDRDQCKYMTFNRVKERGKCSPRSYIAQPFLPGDNSIRLVEDIGSYPQFKETLHGPSLPMTSGNVKMDGSSSLNSVINSEDKKDNTFSINLEPISVNNNSDIFNEQMDSFDDELSQLIIQNNQELEMQNSYLNSITDNRELPSMNPPVKPVTFVKNINNWSYSPIRIDESKITMG